MPSDIRPGLSQYELSDHRGRRRTLSELQQGYPLVLILSRGGFSKRTEATRGTVATTSRDAGGLLPPGDDLDGQLARDE